MKIGLHIPEYAWPGGPACLGDDLARIVRTADDCGFDSICAGDHLFQMWPGKPVEDPMLECYTTLAFIAANTSRAKLIPIVTAVPYRSPGLLTKIVTSLDVLSGGRAWLGIGAGWAAEEAHGLGIPFPSLPRRFEMLEETLQICMQMWKGDERPYQGRHYQLARPLNSPQSLARPHPPIMIGGAGEQKTLLLVARYADACNLYPTPELPRKLAVLRRHCETEGRDYDAIETTCTFHSFDVGEHGNKTGEVIERLRWLAGMGVQTVLGSVTDVHKIAPLEVIARDVIPAVADL
jgi:F420-dependent oxidoreductase-like protein